MKPKLYYFPLEPYIERYTWFLSAPDGWFESSARQAGFDPIRIEGEHYTGNIRKGAVLDYVGRSRWAMSQVDKFLALMESGEINDGDMLYVEDFWHAGIEAIFYARQFGGPKIKIGTFIWAQSIDDSDFMWEARHWARDIEVGFSKGYDAVFTTSPILQELALEAGYGKNIHVTGLPFNSAKLWQQLEDCGFSTSCSRVREGVLFSSRFDSEKNPHFFMDVAERLHHLLPFKLVAPKPIDRISNDPTAIERLKELVSRGVITVIDTSDKETGKLAYYEALASSRIQFNCAQQDWTSWTLLEACMLGAFPIYPNWKDFPRELDNNPSHIYNRLDLEDACNCIKKACNAELNYDLLQQVVERHNKATEKALAILSSL